MRLYQQKMVAQTQIDVCLFVLQSWNLFSNFITKIESTAAYSPLFRVPCSTSVSKCIQLFAITWISTAQHSPPHDLASVDTALIVHQWFGFCWVMSTCQGPLHGAVGGCIASLAGPHAACGLDTLDLNYFLNTSMYGDSTTSLGSLFQHLTTLLEEMFFLISSLHFSGATWCRSLSFRHCYMGEEANSQPHHNPPSGYCRQHCLPWASSSPEEIIPVLSAAPHYTCAPDPSSTLKFREGFEELLSTSNWSPSP